MRKIYMLCFGLILLSACGNITSEDENLLKEQGITTIRECQNIRAIKASIGDDFQKEKAEVYCKIDLKAKHLDQVNKFVNAGYRSKRISEYLTLPYYDIAKTQRYIAYDDKQVSPSEVVTNVNIGLDTPFYENSNTIEERDSMLALVNKYHKLPEGYQPKNLIETPYACTIGKEYSCQSETQYVVSEVGEHFKQLVEAAKEEGITIVSIASYRSYGYQKNLYDYNASIHGIEYADQYYARPGQSEHNSGLAIDVTLDDNKFNEIEQHPKYDWLLDHMADYGFILRYPKDKVNVTGYGYESWHLRYVGKHSAKAIMKQNSTLDEYIAQGGSMS